MLNIPNCINNSNIPLELSLTAPYKSINDLKMIAELTQISCERLREYDVSKITQEDVEANSCIDMQTKFSSLKKFCGVCKFSDSNVLGRLDDELVLLNHIFNHGPDDRISGEQFKYYFLDQSYNAIAITAVLYNLMIDNYGAKNDLCDILISYSKDNEFINLKTAQIIEKVMNSPSTDIDKSIQRLNKTSQRKNPIKHTDVLSLLISNQKSK